MPERPHATVATIVCKQNKFLMVEEHRDGLNVLNQPAGHIENDESLAEAAVRETLEETKWDVTPESFIGIYTLQAKNGITYIRNCLEARPIEYHNQAKLDDGIIAAHWMSYEEILENSHRLRSPLVRQCIEDFLSGQRYPLDILK